MYDEDENPDDEYFQEMKTMQNGFTDLWDRDLYRLHSPEEDSEPEETDYD